jgi:proprotein convertase subtilisin/kexin type 5
VDECLTCIGEDITKCTTCKTFNGTDFYLIHGTTICNESCPDGQFQSNNKCLICNTECLTCSIVGSNCTSCGRVNGIQLYL